MASTPPPPGRVRTPPTPLHGARYDSYEPYSPRRSARVSAQRSISTSSDEPGPSRKHAISHSHLTLTSTATPRKTSLARQQSSQTLSPPSSPETRIHKTPIYAKDALLSARKQRTAQSHSHLVTSNTHFASPQPSPDRASMLPTPNKTPRKRAAAPVGSTARILEFKAHDIDDIMPTPRKRRQPLTLDKFDAQEAQRGNEINIYTDSQDRIPDMDGASDNPFVGPRKTGKSSRSTRGRKVRRTEDEDDEEAEMERMARNDEGVIYVL